MLFPVPRTYYYGPQTTTWQDVTGYVAPKQLVRGDSGSTYYFRILDAKEFAPPAHAWVKLVSSINGKTLFIGRITAISFESQSRAAEVTCESPLKLAAEQRLYDAVRRITYSESGGLAAVPSMFQLSDQDPSTFVWHLLENIWRLLTKHCPNGGRVLMDTQVAENLMRVGQLAVKFVWPLFVENGVVKQLSATRRYIPIAVVDPYNTSLMDFIKIVGILGSATFTEYESGGIYYLHFKQFPQSSVQAYVGVDPTRHWAIQQANVTSMTVSVTRPEIDAVSVSMPLVALLSLCNYSGTAPIVTGSGVGYPFTGLIPAWPLATTNNQPMEVSGFNAPLSNGLYGPGYPDMATGTMRYGSSGYSVNLCESTASTTPFAMANPDLSEKYLAFSGLGTAYRLPSWLTAIATPTEISFGESFKIGPVVLGMVEAKTGDGTSAPQRQMLLGQIQDAKVETREVSGGPVTYVTVPRCVTTPFGSKLILMPIVLTIPMLMRNMRYCVNVRLTDKPITDPTFYTHTIVRDDLPVVIDGISLAKALFYTDSGGQLSVIDELTYLPFDVASVVDGIPRMQTVTVDVNSDSCIVEALYSAINWTSYAITHSETSATQQERPWAILTFYDVGATIEPIIKTVAKQFVPVDSLVACGYYGISVGAENRFIVDPTDIAKFILDSVKGHVIPFSHTGAITIGTYDEAIRPGEITTISDPNTFGVLTTYISQATLDFLSARTAIDVTSDLYTDEDMTKFYTISAGDRYYGRTFTFGT